MGLGSFWGKCLKIIRFTENIRERIYPGEIGRSIYFIIITLTVLTLRFYHFFSHEKLSRIYFVSSGEIIRPI